MHLLDRLEEAKKELEEATLDLYQLLETLPRDVSFWNSILKSAVPNLVGTVPCFGKIGTVKICHRYVGTAYVMAIGEATIIDSILKDAAGIRLKHIVPTIGRVGNHREMCLTCRAILRTENLRYCTLWRGEALVWHLMVQHHGEARHIIERLDRYLTGLAKMGKRTLNRTRNYKIRYVTLGPEHLPKTAGTIEKIIELTRQLTEMIRNVSNIVLTIL